MIQFLGSILGPLFTGLGVSEADFQMYLTQLSGYVYGILAALIVMIAVLILAVKVPKGLKHIVRWQAVLAFVAIVTVLANVICYGPMYSNVSGFLNASKADLSAETVAQSRETVKKIGEEGLVLVKNEGLLPLAEDTKKLNVFGWASINPIFGGVGSGASGSSTAVGILQSFKDAGYETNQALTDMYTEYRAERPPISMYEQDWTLPEPTADAYTDTVMGDAKSFSDTAVIVIGRSGGENADLPTDMNAVIKGTYNLASEVASIPENFAYMNGSYTNNGSYDDFEEGESYLELSRTEEDLVEKVCSEFDKVVVVINANNAMELNWVEDYSQNKRESDFAAATNQFQDYSRGDFIQLSRADSFKNYEEACAAPSSSQYEMSDEVRARVEENAFGTYDGTKYNNDSDTMPATGADNGLVLHDLTGAAYDDPKWDQLLDQLSFDDMSMMINIGGWQTVAIDSVGKIATSDCDGPAGLSNFITGTYGSAYPSETLMAQTWNKELAYEIGQSMGQEYKEANNYGWYGPAMNNHRSAFSGRNFEYYSEDGVLGGYMAANQMNGAAEKGVYAYMKHFALNDQEINRTSILLTFASEQAIREIYLKPFEIATKKFEGTAQAAMSSFNWIGTEPSCANPNLLNTVLRDEWGFTGLVETDYDGSYGYMITDHCIRSGNDLMLGYGNAESNMLSDQSATAVSAMRQACKNILYTIGNSGYYADGDPAGGMTNMNKMFITIDVVIALIIIAIEAILIVRYMKKKRNS